MYNLIYILSYTQCGKQYMGETKHSLHEHIAEHLSYVKYKKDIPTGKQTTIYQTTQ